MIDRKVLAKVGDWDSQWSGIKIDSLRFDPTTPMYRDLHRFLTAALPRDVRACFLEVGAYPGYLMWYFNKYFGYAVDGIEYVSWCCKRARELLKREGIVANVIEADFFSFAVPPAQDLWDVVASSGFIEHYTDPLPVIERHLQLVKPGGRLVLIVPNHATLYGRIMRLVDPGAYARHNQMTLDGTLAMFSRISNATVEVAAHLGRFGFWNSSLYERVLRFGRPAYLSIRAPLWVAEQVGQLLPNSRYLSPMFAVIARKHSE